MGVARGRVDGYVEANCSAVRLLGQHGSEYEFWAA